MKCGIDIIDIKRVKSLVDRHELTSLNRIWTSNELKSSITQNGIIKYDSLAAKFACKEAVSKALGTGFGKTGVHADQIEILKNELGQPYVVLYGSTKKFFEKSGYKSIEVSLTHTAEVSAAICIIF